jgi:hypothetical protein
MSGISLKNGKRMKQQSQEYQLGSRQQTDDLSNRSRRAEVDGLAIRMFSLIRLGPSANVPKWLHRCRTLEKRPTSDCCCSAANIPRFDNKEINTRIEAIHQGRNTNITTFL